MYSAVLAQPTKVITEIAKARELFCMAVLLDCEAQRMKSQALRGFIAQRL